MGTRCLMLLGLGTLAGCPAAPQSDLAAEVAELRARVAELEANAGQTCAGTLSPSTPPVLEVVADARVLEVPSAYPTIQAALDALDTIVFVGGGAATISVADGDHVVPVPIVVRHPQGDRISVVGDPAFPGDVSLDCVASCLRVEGHSLGRFDGFTLRYADTTGNIDNGIEVVWGGRLNAGPALLIDGFSGHGVYVAQSALLVAPGIEVANAGQNGFLVEWGSVARLDGVNIQYAGGDGLQVAMGSAADADAATVSNNVGKGIDAVAGSVVYATAESAVTNNGSVGVYARDLSYVNAELVKSSENGSLGVGAVNGSAVLLSGATVNNNGGFDLDAALGSTMNIDSATTYGDASPTPGTDGGKNSWID